MIARLVRVAIIAAALLIGVLFVPDIEVEWPADAPGIGLTLLALALLFALINASIRPLARIVSIPLNVVTLGVFSILLNAALLLLMAFLVDLAAGPLVVIGGYPPELGLEAISAAAMGAVVIGVVSTVLTILIPDT
jgi:putative membrane protein